MVLKSYLSKTLLLFILLLGVEKGLYAQTLELSKTVSNISTGANGNSASQNHILEYSITARNLTATRITNAMLYDHTPAGAAYVPGSTKLNGMAVADVGSAMPYAGAGGRINSPSQASGVLVYNSAATVTFRVTVTANGGTITNYATLEGTYGTGVIAQNTNTVFTNLSPDGSCSVMYQSTASTQDGTTAFRYIKTVSTTNGTGSPTLFNGVTGPCFNAITGAALTAGSVLVNTAAIAHDKKTNRIYFVNNSSSATQDLSYIDLNTTPVSAKRFVGYPLETTIGNGWNVNRMAFASDGYGYAITSNGQDLIRFSIDPATGIPVISRRGTLINASLNGTNDILAEVGGDIFGDGSGNLYMVANSSKLYKINPNTRVATSLGSVSPFPGTSNSIAIDASGTVYIGGSYQNVFTVNLATMKASSITGGSTSNVWTNGDYTSCALPVLAPALSANKSYRNTNGRSIIISGDTVEYVITVTNSGNINAAGVKLYDSVPGATSYISGSTRLNGVPVADVGGTMPYAVAGGQFIHSSGEDDGIIKPGAAHKAVVIFRAKTNPLQRICNQSRVTLLDADGNSIFINSDDSSQTGDQNSTCFFSDGALPLQNLVFTGSLFNERSNLQWTATHEKNVLFYEVEYSDDGSQFTVLGRVSGRNENTAEARYSFIDNIHSLPGLRYYRLNIVQPGGSRMYSRIVQLSLSAEVLAVQPNPFSNQINIQLMVKTTEIVQIRLLDMNGRVIVTRTKTAVAGNHTMVLTVPTSLSAGMYVLEVRKGKNRIHRTKLLKSL